MSDSHYPIRPGSQERREALKGEASSGLAGGATRVPSAAQKMSSALQRGQNWLMDQYLNGHLPLPGPVLQTLLNVAIESYYRLAPVYPELPDNWRGGDGPIARQSKELMEVHYDNPLILFKNFLGPTMKYTMALYERGARNLEEAQVAMMDDLCEKAGIEDGDTVLDIACGFGSLSAHILQRYPACQVTALNLSRTQVDYIASKQHESGHPLNTGRFQIVKQDFANFACERKFDRIMVIGLFEHINNLRLALQQISGLLAAEGAVLIHFIAFTRIIRSLGDPAADVLLSKHIFPGGRVWYLNELPRHDEHLRVEKSWFLSGINYHRTLDAWRHNFRRNIGKIRIHPAMDERFLRTWDLYLRLCSAAFRGLGGRNLGNGQYLLRHARATG